MILVWMLGLIVAILFVAVLILIALNRLLGSLEGFKRQFIGAMGDEDQVYLRTLAQRAKDQPYR